jgi:hypothetical protein
MRSAANRAIHYEPKQMINRSNNSHQNGWRSLLIMFATIAISVCSAVVFLGYRLRPVGWVGLEDLEVTFHALDAETGLAVANARLDFLTPDSPPVLIANVRGICKVTFKQCLTFGSSGYKITILPPSVRNVSNGWHLKIPDSVVQVSAPGYQIGEPICIANAPTATSLRQGRPCAKLDVWLTLKPLATKRKASKE